MAQEITKDFQSGITAAPRRIQSPEVCGIHVAFHFDGWGQLVDQVTDQGVEQAYGAGLFGVRNVHVEEVSHLLEEADIWDVCVGQDIADPECSRR